jgi:hypothetical protein
MRKILSKARKPFRVSASVRRRWNWHVYGPGGEAGGTDAPALLPAEGRLPPLKPPLLERGLLEYPREP